MDLIYGDTIYVFVFGRCRRSYAAVAPAEYEDDSIILTHNFKQRKHVFAEKIAEL